MNAIEQPVAVIDTNVLLVAISSRSKYHWLYDGLLNGLFNVAITQDILFEYEEVLGNHWNKDVARNAIRSITELPNAIFTPVFCHLHLIHEDGDDNKFVDCAFAANANFIVTHDHHFQILKRIKFPKIPIIDIHEFERLIR